MPLPEPLFAAKGVSDLESVENFPPPRSASGSSGLVPYAGIVLAAGTDQIEGWFRMKTVLIIQARMGSTRLPGKVLRPLLGKPMLCHMVERIAHANAVDQVVVATSDLPGDGLIRDFCDQQQIYCYAGSESNVLDRFYHAARLHQAERVIRVTADCPLVDPVLIDQLVAFSAARDLDHGSVATGAAAALLDGGKYPNGYDAECLKFEALAEAWSEATLDSDKEHVTPFIWRQPERFSVEAMKSPRTLPSHRLTVDYDEDFELIEAIYRVLYKPGHPFSLDQVLDFLSSRPDLAALNSRYIGQEGYASVWNPAK